MKLTTSTPSPQSSSFCIAPWTHIFAKPTGIVHPCCESQTPLGRLDGQSLLEAWNSEEYQELRRQFLKGQAPEGCKSCYSLEKSGAPSMRQQMNERHAGDFKFVQETTAEGAVPRLNLRHLDIRWSNKCNFRCRSCSVEWSSSWLGDILALEGGTHVLNSHQPERYHHQVTQEPKVLMPHLDWEEIENVVLPQVESISFAGGEPLIQEETYRILDALDRLKRYRVKIAIVTNLSHFGSKSQNLFALLSKFQQLTVTASADATGARYDYFRKGGSWETFSRNFDLLNGLMRERAVKNDKAMIYFSVFWPNAFHAAEAIPQMEDRFETEVHANISTSPESSRIDYLPSYVKTALHEHYAGRNHPQLEKILRFMTATELSYPESMRHFRNYVVFTGKVDKLRGEDFLSVFPEWKRFMRNDHLELLSPPWFHPPG